MQSNKMTFTWKNSIFSIWENVFSGNQQWQMKHGGDNAWQTCGFLGYMATKPANLGCISKSVILWSKEIIV